MCLYELSENMLSIVAKMCQVGWGEGGEVWKWKHKFFAWEEEMIRE